MTRLGVVKQTLRNVLINFKFSLPRSWTLFRPSPNRAKAQNYSKPPFPYSWDANGTLDVIISNINCTHYFTYTWYVYMHLIHVPSWWPRFTTGQKRHSDSEGVIQNCTNVFHHWFWDMLSKYFNNLNECVMRVYKRSVTTLSM